MIKLIRRLKQQKLVFDNKGEKVINIFDGFQNKIKLSFLGITGYLYYLYTIEPVSQVAKNFFFYQKPIMGILGGLIIYRFSKFAYKLSVLQGGSQLKFQKYPFSGFGHWTQIVIDIEQIQFFRYQRKEKYNPFSYINKDYAFLYYKSSFLGFPTNEYIIFRFSPDYQRDIFKLITLKKPVTDQNLKSLQKAVRKDK